jgi:hypothetical protein
VVEEVLEPGNGLDDGTELIGAREPERNLSGTTCGHAASTAAFMAVDSKTKMTTLEFLSRSRASACATRGVPGWRSWSGCTSSSSVRELERRHAVTTTEGLRTRSGFHTMHEAMAVARERRNISA